MLFTYVDNITHFTVKMISIATMQNKKIESFIGHL